MNKKIKYLAIAVILTVLAISAIAGLGDTLTQTQFKNLDVDNHDFKPIVQPNKIKWDSFIATVTIESFEEAESEYETISINKSAYVSINSYVFCREAAESKAACIAKVKAELIQNLKNELKNEKTSLKREQAKIEYANELTDKSITITAIDIKNAAQVKP